MIQNEGDAGRRNADPRSTYIDPLGKNLPEKSGSWMFRTKPLILLVGRARFELATNGLKVALSYRNYAFNQCLASSAMILGSYRKRMDTGGYF